jgi:hypothetical protein
MGILADLIWGKGATARESAVRGLLFDVSTEGASEEVLTYIAYGRGQKALDAINRTSHSTDLSELAGKLQTALSSHP